MLRRSACSLPLTVTRMNFSASLSVAISGVLLALALSACNRESSPPSPAASAPATSSAASPSDPSPSPPPSPAVSPEPERNLISAEGIGAARLGITFGELKRRLSADAELAVKSPFIVDFDAVAVRQAGEVQYYILYLSGQTLSDTDVIQGILTDNPRFRTAENVGPQTPLTEAEQIYGQATLSYNRQNESREYARFAQQPPALSFSTGNGNSSTAGIYSTPQADYNETQEFRQDAAIQSVLVVCLTEDCAPAAAPPSSP